MLLTDCFSRLLPACSPRPPPSRPSTSRSFPRPCSTIDEPGGLSQMRTTEGKSKARHRTRQRRLSCHAARPCASRLSRRYAHLARLPVPPRALGAQQRRAQELLADTEAGSRDGRDGALASPLVSCCPLLSCSSRLTPPPTSFTSLTLGIAAPLRQQPRARMFMAPTRDGNRAE